MKIANKKTLRITGIILLIVLFSNRQFDSWIMGEARYDNPPLRAGNIKIPGNRALNWGVHSSYADSLCRNWAGKPLGDWKEDGKTNAPRVMLGRLMTGTAIPETNALLARLQPRGKVGSRWFLNPEGDYDFTLTPLTAILYLFDDKPELLWPETKKHLVDVLLNAEGGKFTDAVPGTLGRVKETENHLLMTEGSRYLKNKYLLSHGNTDSRYDNLKNGMEKHVLTLLHEITTIGLYEFNSVPYLGYTIAAVLNLEAFGSDPVRIAARDALDYINFCYALGSYQYKYYPPFRRRLEKARITGLSLDYQTEFLKAWLSFLPDMKPVEKPDYGTPHGLIGACLPYRPADEVVELIFNKTPGYFVKLGHGEKSSPELYAAGPGYLLSAGGVNRGKWSNIVARPICLFLDDHSEDLSEVIHMNGKGKDFMKWNNTGVYKDFACTGGPVFVPHKFKPAAQNNLWTIYQVNDSFSVAVHSSENLGIITVFKKQQAVALAAELLHCNPDPELLKNSFQFPGGSKITYDLKAKKNCWVIRTVDGIEQDRRFDQWALLEGDYQGVWKPVMRSKGTNQLPDSLNNSSSK